MMKLNEKQVERLAKGQKSGGRVGSRGVGHRLRQHEQKQFRVARERGYLLCRRGQRANLHNVWYLYCQHKGCDCWVVKQEGNDTQYTVLKNQTPVHAGTRVACLSFIQDNR